MKDVLIINTARENHPIRCCVVGCSEPHDCMGYCAEHYEEYLQPEVELAERIEDDEDFSVKLDNTGKHIYTKVNKSNQTLPDGTRRMITPEMQKNMYKARSRGLSFTEIVKMYGFSETSTRRAVNTYKS